MGETTLTISAQLDEIKSITDAVGQAALTAGFDDRSAYACELAVCEACENIVVHGYTQERSGTIEATIQTSPGELTVELRDRAAPFDPTAAPAPQPDPAEEPTIGGFGLYIVRKVMDEVSYERSKGENRLVLRKSQDTGTD